MQKISPPTKPFSNYKWRWAVLTPTESLNNPPIFLGVLRVFNDFPNSAPSSQNILDGLAVVQTETKSTVNLVRSQDRNLIRNSGQYWKALALLQEVSGKVIVSPLGKLLASGEITQAEFATIVLKTLELPNRRIEDNTTDWENAGLKIKPLELILDILGNITERYDLNEAYITPFELVRIIIPLAGNKALLTNYSDAIIQYRRALLDISNWPDCAVNSNDKRMAREFLLFLCNYGFCKAVPNGKGNENVKYMLASISKEEIIELRKLKLIENYSEDFVRTIRETQIPANVERKRITREVLERPYQNIFRKNILAAFNSTCIITGVTIENVLEASHIIDVQYNGSDKIENGLCMRSDIHQLFDSRHLKLMPSGDIILSDSAATRNNYKIIPKQITIPNFINKDYLAWRVKYT
jgi:HNH endonuclease